MLQIRLLRFGKKNKPSFRLILVHKGKRPGKYLEYLGSYFPLEKTKKTDNIATDRINYWISKGAQPTPTVHNILINARVITGKKVKIKISKKKGEAKPVEAKPAEAAKPAAPKAETPKVEAPKTEEKPAA